MEISKLFILGALFALPVCATDSGDGIAIKQLHLGMSEDEVRALQNGTDSINDNFTVGGARVWNFRFIYDAAGQTDRERRNSGRTLQAFSFSFLPHYFEAIKSAVATKFQPLTCVSMDLQNRFGAKYVGESCVYRAKNGDELLMSQYAGSLDNGSLEVITATLAETRKKLSRGKKDDI